MGQRKRAAGDLFVVWARGVATVADRTAPLIRKLLRRVCPGMLKTGSNLNFDRKAVDLRYNVDRSIAMAGPDPTIFDSCIREN